MRRAFTRTWFSALAPAPTSTSAAATNSSLNTSTTHFIRSSSVKKISTSDATVKNLFRPFIPSDFHPRFELDKNGKKKQFPPLVSRDELIQMRQTAYLCGLCPSKDLHLPDPSTIPPYHPRTLDHGTKQKMGKKELHRIENDYEFVQGWKRVDDKYNPNEQKEWSVRVNDRTYHPIDRRLAADLTRFYAKLSEKEQRRVNKLRKQLNKLMARRNIRELNSVLDAEALRLEEQREKLESEGKLIQLPQRFLPRVEQEKVMSENTMKIKEAMDRMPERLNAYREKRKAGKANKKP